MSHNNGSFPAFLGGAVLGAAFALLFAPQKGEKTRKELKDKIDGLRQRVYVDEEEILSAAQERVENIEDEVLETIQEAAASVDETRPKSKKKQ